MAGRRSGEIALRNDQIYAEWTRNPDLPAIAAKYKITPQRVGQIIAQYHPDLETEHERALLRGSIWNLSRQVQEVIDNPGVKLGPNGRPAEDFDGNAITDLTTLVEAAKVQAGIYKQIAQLVGAEKVVPKQVQHSFDLAMQQKNDAIAAAEAKIEARRREMEQLAKRAGVIPGEVLPALPPPEPEEPAA